LKRAIVLFAHGSRAAAWARPFEEIASRIRSREPSIEVMLAWLEVMKPSLGEALDALAAKQVSSVRVVPVFFGIGGHVREDLPRLVAAARAAHPELQIAVEKPIGEERAITDAIADFISAR
jgi:sirohydrochlorin cobaltochelatase